MKQNNPQRLVVAVTGLGQVTGQSGNGLEDLLAKLNQQSSDVSTALFTWNHNLQDIIHHIQRFKSTNPTAVIYLIGYSYGGTTVAAIARDLNALGIRVQAMFLTDPVWRRFQYIISIFSMKGRGCLVISRGVGNLFSWFQTATPIRGTTLKLEASNLTTWQLNREVFKTRHFDMDSVPHFHRTVLQELQK